MRPFLIGLYAYATLVALLGVAALALSLELDKPTTLGNIYLINGFLLLAAAALFHLGVARAYDACTFRHIDVGTWMCAGAAAAMHVTCVVRLASYAYFHGDFLGVDFGAMVKDGEANVSFDGWNIEVIAHVLQGAVALLLFPLEPLLRVVWIVQVSQASAFFIAIYPLYNLIKRVWVSANEPEFFATSSFSNNNFEWTTGFLCGTSLALLCMAFTRYFSVGSANALCDIHICILAVRMLFATFTYVFSQCECSLRHSHLYSRSANALCDIHICILCCTQRTHKSHTIDMQLFYTTHRSSARRCCASRSCRPSRS
jgi:hypothetical protein